MKLFRRFAFALTALALLASQPARADVYGYIDENGLAHFASERVDDRYVLFMKGAVSASCARCCSTRTCRRSNR